MHCLKTIQKYLEDPDNRLIITMMAIVVIAIVVCVSQKSSFTQVTTTTPVVTPVVAQADPEPTSESVLEQIKAAIKVNASGVKDNASGVKANSAEIGEKVGSTSVFSFL
uniref:Uncharacterized protein n=1 Tax=viral metagenome TaxID=1070528 RepID=A0A6C0KA60_9ZZZZ